MVSDNNMNYEILQPRKIISDGKKLAKRNYVLKKYFYSIKPFIFKIFFP